jgi:hypothetical protein
VPGADAHRRGLDDGVCRRCGAAARARPDGRRRRQGGYGVTLECGRHEDPAAPEVAYRAIRQTVALLGLADLPLSPPARAFERLRLATVVDRDHPDDRFVRPWASFDALRAGEPVAERTDGTRWCAPRDGRIVFPDASARPGHEWFYFAEPLP